MARGITLASWPGTLPEQDQTPSDVDRKSKITATEADRKAALAAVDFFYKECKLGATLLARKIGWTSDVKSVLQRNPGLTIDHLRKLATAIELSFEEFLAIGIKPSRTRIKEFKLKFIEMELVEKPKYHFSR